MAEQVSILKEIGTQMEGAVKEPDVMQEKEQDSDEEGDNRLDSGAQEYERPTAASAFASAAAASTTELVTVTQQERPKKRARGRPKDTHMWEHKYDELCEYFEFHGHSNVPHQYSVNPSLATFCRTQREQYRAMQDGRPSKLSMEQIQLLEKVKFSFESKREEKWMTHYNNLVAFIQKYGAREASASHRVKKHDPKLSRWLGQQQRQYNLHKDGKPSLISKERVELLDKLGLEWKSYAQWEDRYEELVALYNKHNKDWSNLSVPDIANKEGNAELACFVTNQRKQYTKWQNGKKSPMNQQRFDLLSQINFPFRLKEPNKDFMYRYQELLRYHEFHGDALVPKRFPENPPLGHFVYDCRKQYKKYLAQEKTTLTPERIALLNKLDFQWSVRDPRPRQAQQPNTQQRAINGETARFGHDHLEQDGCEDGADILVGDEDVEDEFVDPDDWAQAVQQAEMEAHAAAMAAQAAAAEAQRKQEKALTLKRRREQQVQAAVHQQPELIQYANRQRHQGVSPHRSGKYTRYSRPLL